MNTLTSVRCIKPKQLFTLKRSSRSTTTASEFCEVTSNRGPLICEEKLCIWNVSFFFFFAIKLFIYSQDAAAFRGCTNGCHADLFKRIGYQLNVAHLFQTQFRLLRVHTHQRLPLILRWYRLVTGFFNILQAKEHLADRETKQGPLTTHTVYNCIQWLAKL